MRMLQSLWRDRELVFELSRRELFQAHTGHIFGGMWVFANPLLMLLVYFLVFRFIFPMRLPGSGSAEAFLLAGLVQWITTADVLARACYCIRSNAGLVKQINFPIEALIAKMVLASLFVQIVMTAGLFAILLSTGAISLAALSFWILALAIQAMFLLGSALLISAITPFLPDTSEIVGIVARLGLFMTPILYPASQFGWVAEAAFYLNPFSYFAWIHQDAIFRGGIEHPGHWLGAVLVAAAALAAGQAAFRAMSPAFNDVL